MRVCHRTRHAHIFGETEVIDQYFEARLVARIVELATQYDRYGYRRITALPRREGRRVNTKRLERIWRYEGPNVPKKQAKRDRPWLSDGSCVRLRAGHRDHVGPYDFIADSTHDDLAANAARSRFAPAGGSYGTSIEAGTSTGARHTAARSDEAHVGSADGTTARAI